MEGQKSRPGGGTKKSKKEQGLEGEGGDGRPKRGKTGKTRGGFRSLTGKSSGKMKDRRKRKAKTVRPKKGDRRPLKKEGGGTKKGKRPGDIGYRSTKKTEGYKILAFGKEKKAEKGKKN